MSNFSNSIDLQKLPGVKVVKFPDESGNTKTYACIPLDEGYIVTGEKGIYMNVMQQETKEQRFGQSHFLKPSYTKEAYDNMTEEQRKSIPIVGNSRVIEFTKTNSAVESAQVVQPMNEEPKGDKDNLPF